MTWIGAIPMLLVHCLRKVSCMRDSTETRRNAIAQLITDQGFIRSSELSEQLGVSIVTIRQDIDSLCAKGVAQRTYGGAIRLESPTGDSAFAVRAKQHSTQKTRIGAAAAALIQHGETILLDAGSTCFEVARHLPTERNITVVTCGLNNALEAASKAGVNVIVGGGVLNPNTLSAVGPLCEQMMQEIYADHLFLGTYGVHLGKGLAERNYQLAHLKRLLIASAKKVVLVCDSSKFGNFGPVLSSSLDVVNHVVTDRGIPEEYREWFAARGVPVDVA
jgi:DeoR family transcriptional regulator of aga operon